MSMLRLHEVECQRGDFTLRVAECGIEQGTVYAVTGPNGCGKTALLRVLGLLDCPISGQVCLDGKPVNHGNAQELLRLRRRIGFVMQNPYLFNSSVYDNVAYGLRVRGEQPAAIRERVNALLETFGLGPLARRAAHTLSGGEAQRVAIARSLVLDAEVLLLDEPTAAVDRDHVRTVEELIMAAASQRGAAVVLSTHSRSQARRMAHNHISILQGWVRTAEYDAAAEDVAGAGPMEQRGCTGTPHR